MQWSSEFLHFTDHVLFQCRDALGQVAFPHLTSHALLQLFEVSLQLSTNSFTLKTDAAWSAGCFPIAGFEGPAADLVPAGPESSKHPNVSK